jgi:uncharacterized FlaG/YvyC family protein
MKSQYLKGFMKFKSEVELLEDAKNATYELSDEILNSVILSGEIIDTDTHERINEIGSKYGLLVMVNELTILYRDKQ